MAEDARPPAVRASDAERELVMTRLRDAAAEGRLTFEELADRVEATAGAVTRSDLERVTEDLPAEPSATPSTEAAPVPTRASTVFADVRRAGTWTVPAAGKWQSLFGDVVLDLREARVTSPEVRIDAGSIFGDVELLVPEGVEVEIRARTLFGDIEQEAGETAPPGAARIILTGGTVFGDVRVRARRLRERLAERLDERRRRRLQQPD
jgi:hypothetical protein